MKQRELGRTKVPVSAIGLGAMPLSLDERPAEAEAIRVIHRALDLGITLIDTADSYCIDERDKHHNEKLIAKALAAYGKDASGVIVATKGGLMRPNGDWTTNGDPKHIRRTIRESYSALGGQRPIPLWQLHAPDSKFDLCDTLKPVREAVDEGLIRFVGLSNVTVREIEQAREIVQIVSVQNQYNPWHREPEKDGVLAYCEKNGLTFLPWSPLGGGQRHEKIPEIDVVKHMAAEKSISPYRVILAWMLAKSPCIIPIPGATRIASVEDSAGAVNVTLTPADIKKIEDGL